MSDKSRKQSTPAGPAEASDDASATVKESDSRATAGTAHYAKLYPEAVGILGAPHSRLRDVLPTAIVVIDTNAMLVPFNTGSSTLIEIRKTYSKLVQAKRLVIPGHAAREFAANRPVRLTDLYKSVSDKSNAINIGPNRYPLLEESEAYKKVQRLEQALMDLAKEYRSALKDLLDEMQEWTWDDPVSAMYREVLPAAVHDPQLNEASLRERHAAAAELKLPPGYKDGGKAVNSDGDLRLWMTILDLAKTRRSHLVLVSGDEKSDWWHRSNNRGLYPRFELVDEYRRESGGKSFHICSFSEFLSKFGADESVVEEVKLSELTVHLDRVSRSSRRSLHAMRAEQAVHAWLTGTYPFLRCVPAQENSRLDFVLSDTDGANSGIVVKYLAEDAPILHYLMNFVRRFSDDSRDATDDTWLILVVPDETKLQRAVRFLTTRVRAPDGLRVIPAILSAEGALEVRDVLGVLPKF